MNCFNFYTNNDTHRTNSPLPCFINMKMMFREHNHFCFNSFFLYSLKFKKLRSGTQMGCDWTNWKKSDSCCVSIQGLHHSEERLKANYVTTPCKGCPNSKALPNAAHKRILLFPFFGECTTTVLLGLTHPKILCMSEKEEREIMATLRGVDRHFCEPGQ